MVSIGDVMDSRTKVLFITGGGRSGSTLLDNILGQLNGFFTVGELWLWARRYRENLFCGCGTRIRACRVWRSILADAFGDPDNLDAEQLFHQFEAGCKLRHFPLIFAPGGPALLRSLVGPYLHALGKLYQSIQSVTSSAVIIDSSKFPPYGYSLGLIPSLDVYVVHLVRDPHAVAYSWLRQSEKARSGLAQEDPLYRRQFNASQSSLRWSTVNAMVEVLWGRSRGRYMMLRYEDLMSDPQRSIGNILNFIGEDPGELPFTGFDRVVLKANHTVSGNPVRFNHGTVTLRLDNEWESKLGKADRKRVGLLTHPLRVRYGYV